MNIYTKSAREGMDICVTCSSVCEEVQLELLAEDTTTVLRRLLHDFDLDSCLKILRPNKKLSLCETCHEILRNASLFRNKALKSLRKLEKENQLQQNTQSASAVGNTLTSETIDIKDEIDPYQAEEQNPPGALQFAALSHKTTESYDLPSFDEAHMKKEYDSDDYASSEFHSVSSKNKIAPKEKMIETHLLDCEEKIGSALIVLNEALPEREGQEPVPAPATAPQEPRRRQRGHQHRRGRKYQMYRRFGSRDARSGSPGPRTGDRRSQVHDQDRSRSRSPLSCSSRGRSEPAGRGGRGSASGWGRGSASGCGRGLSIGGDRGLSSAGERGRGARGHAGHGGRQHHHRGGRGSAQAQPPQFVHPFNCVTYIRSVVVHHYY